MKTSVCRPYTCREMLGFTFSPATLRGGGGHRSHVYCQRFSHHVRLVLHLIRMFSLFNPVSAHSLNVGVSLLYLGPQRRIVPWSVLPVSGSGSRHRGACFLVSYDPPVTHFLLHSHPATAAPGRQLFIQLFEGFPWQMLTCCNATTETLGSCSNQVNPIVAQSSAQPAWFNTS